MIMIYDLLIMFYNLTVMSCRFPVRCSLISDFHLKLIRSKPPLPKNRNAILQFADAPKLRRHTIGYGWRQTSGASLEMFTYPL